MVLTVSPYFSSNKAIAPSEIALSIGTFLFSSKTNFPSIQALTKFSISASCPIFTLEKCEKSKRKLSELTLLPFC